MEKYYDNACDMHWRAWRRTRKSALRRGITIERMDKHATETILRNWGFASAFSGTIGPWTNRGPSRGPRTRSEQLTLVPIDATRPLCPENTIPLTAPEYRKYRGGKITLSASMLARVAELAVFLDKRRRNIGDWHQRAITFPPKPIPCVLPEPFPEGVLWCVTCDANHPFSAFYERDHRNPRPKCKASHQAAVRAVARSRREAGGEAYFTWARTVQTAKRRRYACDLSEDEVRALLRLWSNESPLGSGTGPRSRVLTFVAVDPTQRMGTLNAVPLTAPQFKAHFKYPAQLSAEVRERVMAVARQFWAEKEQEAPDTTAAMDEGTSAAADPESDSSADEHESE